ncbi:biotin/lipoate--protein ligase family protein [Methylobacterium marchantiae]|uniref:Biotin/lipoate--protein ligase family protein n=1 Tax=Methylobacterium marchantiae TaxID=600331 RepID=A0ABW3WZB7_9HYPH|nr:hypothetical protein AIGOOFII_0709 [Methylobacterium marchantiae]
MVPSPDHLTHSSLALPPAFSLRVSDGADSAFDEACRSAAADDATGLLVWRRNAALLDLAVVLSPDEPLSTARRAFFAGMVAFAEALGAHAPPEIPVMVDWPDTIRFDGARLGGGRLGWPAACSEDDVPEWLVFSALVIASKAEAGDPGLTPDSTSLENEGFALEEGHGRVVESFARHLTKAFALWEEDGFEAIGRRYLTRLADVGPDARLDPRGDLIEEGGAGHTLVPGLAKMAWRDPRTGEPLL